MNKIARISVRDIRRIDLIKIEITQIFGINSELSFDFIVVAMFDLGLQINLAAKF